jgi:protein-tyrosine phosphatase/arsenate reductase
MLQPIKQYCDKLIADFAAIPKERQALLEELSNYVSSKKESHQAIQLVYICTHNSRRSHFGQIWAQVAANYFNVKNVTSFSGGTEATAFNSNAINAIKRVGFDVKPLDETSNKRYHVVYNETENPIICFSKVYDDAQNPQTNFAAIMTCSDAEENCPFIPGVELRIGTTYDDPKAFDNTPLQDAKYDERCKQIALETLYVFSKVK